MNEKKSSQPLAQADSAGNSKQTIGEGSYEGTRDYQKNIASYLEDADVAADARAARPGSKEEAEQLKRAEQEGLSHSKAKGE